MFVIEYTLTMKILKIITGFFLCFCITFTVFYGRKKIGEKVIDNLASAYQGVVSIWHVDTFEGGVGSRRVFLLNSASNFEKEHKGTLFMVSNFTVDGAIQSIKEGKWPDVISYGVALQPKGVVELSLDNSSIYGCIGENNYAITWCRGEYVLLVKDGINIPEDKVLDEVIVSQGEFTQPLTAFTLSGYRANKVTQYQPADAFSHFFNSKCKYMVGTQRDVVRLSYKNTNANVVVLDGYNDLYQYASITSKDSNKIPICIEFLNYLTSNTVQQRIKNIKMFSTYVVVNYDEEVWLRMQSATFNKGVSAFIDRETIKEMQRLSVKSALGDENAKIKIKNITF